MVCHDVRDHGAVGDGRTLDTAAINCAIEAAASHGGGTVVFPAGVYLSHSVRLRSRIALRLDAGAVLLAADPPPPGEPGGYDAPEPAALNLHQDFGHSRFRNSLIWGEELQDVAIYGPGRIEGRGLSRGNGRIALPVGQVAPQPAGHLPDVLEADGPVPVADPLTEPPGEFGYPNARDTLPAGVGNKAIGLRACRNVTIRDLTILHGGHFALLASDCDNVTIDGLLIDTNRDGIDIDGCRNVRISQCSVNSPWDDGICVKSSCGFGGIRAVENVTITECYVSGFEEGTLYDGTRSRVIRHRGGPIGRIKLGTESSGGFRNVVIANCIFDYCRGLALEQVDGAVMEDIVVSNLVMREVMNAPIFVRLGGRLRAPEADVPGTVCRIAISNVVAYDVAPDHGIFIAGLPGHPVCDVRLSGIQLHSRGGGTEEEARRSVPEMAREYPEPMLFGRLPAWGLYVRHAAGLYVRDLALHLLRPDRRPAIHLEEVAAADISGVCLPPGATATDWTVVETRALRLRDCDGMAGATG
jgi:polygalacturonase